MKIDEPKTPYVRSFKYDNLTEEEKGQLQYSSTCPALDSNCLPQLSLRQERP